MPENTFKTLDSYLAGYLALRGFKPDLIEQAGKVAFSFPLTGELRRSLDGFNEGATVKASALVFEIKTLKSRIHDLRREKGLRYGFYRSPR